jgi:hypothetical protein
LYVREKNQVFFNTSPLQMAVFFNDVQTVEYFARHGALVSGPEEMGVTPLERAAFDGLFRNDRVARRLRFGLRSYSCATTIGGTS